MSPARASLFDRPAPAPVLVPGELVGRSLRPFQRMAFEGGVNPDGKARLGIRACLAANRSTAAIIFTGGGKTTVAAQAALEARGRVLFMAHTDPLVGQARDELQEVTGMPWDLEQAGWTAEARGRKHVVASVQSLMQAHRMQRFDPATFALIIVDEAHHYVAAAFKRPLDYFASAKVLAITATPYRQDRKAMGRYVQSVAFKMDLVDAIAEGWSVPIRVRPPIKLDVDMSDVRTVTDQRSERFGDFVESELEEKVRECVGPIVAACLKEAGDMRSAIFTPRVESSHAAAKALNAQRAGIARAIDGGMERDEKRAALVDHKRGAYQFIANCNILSEGYSDRDLRCLIDAAPTKSVNRKVQRLGRVLRPSADANVDACETADERKAAIARSSKPNAVWIDLKFNFKGPDELVTPVDILGGSYTDKERAAAKKELEKKGGDPMAALEAARKRLAAAANKAKVTLELGSIDPTKGARKAKAKAPTGPEPMSGGQLRAFARFGLTATPDMTKAQASKMLAYEFLADSKGWCDARQRDWLQKHLGVSGRGLARDRGAALAGAWVANGRQRLGHQQLTMLMSREVGAEG